MSSNTSSGGSMAQVDCDVLKTISSYVDILISVSSTDGDLRAYAIKFQYEHAADRAAFQQDERADKSAHMLRSLERMSDFALNVARNILQRTKLFATRSAVDSTQSSSESQSPTSPGLFHSSSLEDFAEGTQTWLENGALLSQAAVEVLSSVLVVHPVMRQRLQAFMLDRNVVGYLSEAFGVSTEHEVAFFQEGYRTGHMTLLSNLTYKNKIVSEAVVNNSILLSSVLSGTKIDVENPGMVEWAKFTIHNLCDATPLAREKLRQMTAFGLDGDSQRILDGKVKYTVTEAGAVQFDSV